MGYCCSITMNSDVNSKDACSTDFLLASGQCSPTLVQPHSTLISMWFQAVAQATDICVALGGKTGHGYKQRP